MVSCCFSDLQVDFYVINNIYGAFAIVVNPGRTSLGSIECRGLNQKAMQWCTAREQPPKHLDSLTRRKTQFEEMKRVMGACILFGTPFTHPPHLLFHPPAA